MRQTNGPETGARPRITSLCDYVNVPTLRGLYVCLHRVGFRSLPDI